MKQVNISRNLDHPCITKVLEVFNSEKLFVIAMEYAPGGELFEEVVKEYGEEFMNKETAKLRFYQISHATAHLCMPQEPKVRKYPLDEYFSLQSAY